MKLCIVQHNFKKVDYPKSYKFEKKSKSIKEGLNKIRFIHNYTNFFVALLLIYDQGLLV